MTAKKKVDIQKTGSREICGIINLVVFVLLCLSLFSYDWRDISWLEDPPKETPNNMFGRVGAWVSFFLFNAFGLGAYLVPFVFLGVALIQFLRQDLRALPKFGWGFLIVCAVSGLLQVQYESFLTTCRELNLDHAGGRLSIEIVDGVLVFLVKPLGATLICSFLLFIGIVMFVGWNEMINGSKKGVAWSRGLAANARARAYERQNHAEQAPPVLLRPDSDAYACVASPFSPPPSAQDAHAAAEALPAPIASVRHDFDARKHGHAHSLQVLDSRQPLSCCH